MIMAILSVFIIHLEEASIAQRADPVKGANIEQLIQNTSGDAQINDKYRQLFSADSLPQLYMSFSAWETF